MALVSCPTASIGCIDDRDFTAARRAFPEPITDGVHFLGFHEERSFAAQAYLLVRPDGNVMIDVPRFVRSQVDAIEKLGGVRTIFLTHRDDVYGHEKWAKHFGAGRVIHADDVEADTAAAELKITGREPQAIGPGLVAIPTPGHTRGSMCLFAEEGHLFTGDHLAFDHEKNRLHAFRDYCWFDRAAQTESMERLRAFAFKNILPGHGRRFMGSVNEAAAALEALTLRMHAAAD